MLYLLYGDIEYLIDKEITKIINDNKIDDINISKYELDNINYKDIIEDASTISLFASKKAIIVSNAYLFTSDTKSLDLTLFEEYFNNYNPDTILIFKLKESKIDERKKVVKIIKKNGVVKDYNQNNDLNKIVLDMFDNYKISKTLITLLVNRVGTDIYTLKNEIDKIKLYKDNDLNIIEEDILSLTSENLEADLFKLIDAIIDNNKESGIELYKEMLKYNLEPIQIIVSLANKFRLIYQVKELSLRGYNQGDIASDLHQKPGYIYFLMQQGKKYSSDKLVSLLKDLSELDYQIKSGSVDKELAFELFILRK